MQAMKLRESEQVETNVFFSQLHQTISICKQVTYISTHEALVKASLADLSRFLATRLFA
jgi:hypothetical protein